MYIGVPIYIPAATFSHHNLQRARFKTRHFKLYRVYSCALEVARVMIPQAARSAEELPVQESQTNDFVRVVP